MSVKFKIKPPKKYGNTKLTSVNSCTQKSKRVIHKAIAINPNQTSLYPAKKAVINQKVQNTRKITIHQCGDGSSTTKFLLVKTNSFAG